MPVTGDSLLIFQAKALSLAPTPWTTKAVASELCVWRFCLLDQARSDLPIELADVPLISALFWPNAGWRNDLRMCIGRQSIDIFSRILVQTRASQGGHFRTALDGAGKHALDAALGCHCGRMVDQSRPNGRCILVRVECGHQTLNMNGLASE
jgi:hypothetical protein